MKAKRLIDKLLVNNKEHESVIPFDKLNALSLVDQTKLVEEISEIVIENPEMNVKNNYFYFKIHHMQSLFHFIEGDDIYTILLSMCSLCEVFKDIAPL